MEECVVVDFALKRRLEWSSSGADSIWKNGFKILFQKKKRQMKSLNIDNHNIILHNLKLRIINKISIRVKRI